MKKEDNKDNSENAKESAAALVDTTTDNTAALNTAATNTTAAAPEAAPDGNEDGTWQRPVAMKRDSNIIHWLIFLAIICFSIALWPYIKRTYYSIRNSFFDGIPEDQRTAECFVAISYRGVAEETSPNSPFISKKLFAEHIQALKDLGYTPITLQDVSDFYHKKRKLPPKAILITFEDGYRSTMKAVGDILLEHRWHATMGVVTKYVREENRDYILANYLRDMKLDATWDLANESDMGESQIVTSPDGNKAPFYTSPMWLEESKRREHLFEFEKRIAQDHTNSLQVFEKYVGHKPIAFFFPYGNYGQYDSGNKALREANVRFVEENYELGFVLNRIALNDRDNDYRRLNRLIVEPNTSAADLVRRLENAWPFDIHRKHDEAKIDAMRWIPDEGQYNLFRDNALQSNQHHTRYEASGNHGYYLSACNPVDPAVGNQGATGGGKSWIAGSGGFYDGSIEMSIFLIRGEFYIYLRQTSDDNYIRIAITDKGSASIAQALPGVDVQYLAVDSLKEAVSYNTYHRILVTIRKDVFYVTVDDQLLFDGGVHVTPTTPGMVGIGIWDSVPGLARVVIDETYLRSYVGGIITWQEGISPDSAYLYKKLKENCFRYDTIAVPWINIDERAHLTYPQPDNEIIQTVAKSNHADIYATLYINELFTVPGIRAPQIVDHVQTNNYQGVFIDAINFPVDPDKVGTLKKRTQILAQALNDKGYKLAIRFPTDLEAHSAVSSYIDSIPNSKLVSDSAVVPVGLDPDLSIRRIEIPPPANEAETGYYYQLCAICDYDAPRDGQYVTKEQFRRAGIADYNQADYKNAITNWVEWQKRIPRSPEPHVHIGNAYARMHDYEKADQSYSQALELEPGRIDVVIERIRVLELMKKTEEAKALLDKYAKAFPRDPKISIEQAYWLNRRDKREESKTLLRSIIKDYPHNITARLALQETLDSPRDRYENMHQLLAIGTKNDSQIISFGRNISTAELLSTHESGVFFSFIRNTATNAPNDAIRKVYSDLLPITQEVSEKFNATRISDSWIQYGSHPGTLSDTYELRAASDMSEAYLKLKQSELIRDGYIEVDLGESTGAFWLYARRSSTAMIRFGFESDGYLRIQAWKNGEVRTSESVAWIRPPGTIRVRLEIRGNGAIGYIDDKPVFSTPLAIPKDIAYGWWGIAPFSPELGVASAQIERIAASPLSPTLALVKPDKESDIESILDSLRTSKRDISAIAPVLFTQSHDGQILTTPTMDMRRYNMYTSYHRIRFMPAATLDYNSEVKPENIKKLIDENKLNGLVLIVKKLPSEKWFTEVTKLTEETDTNIIVVQSEKPLWAKNPDGKSPETVTLREIERGSTLLQPNQQLWTTPLIPYNPETISTRRHSTHAPTAVLWVDGLDNK